MPGRPPARASIHRPSEPVSRRRERARRAAQWVLLFVSTAVVVNGLVGERGVLQMLQARREYQQLEASVAALRQQHAVLQEQARQLQEDPVTIEQLARQELGLIRRGEIVIILKDAPSATARR